MQRKPQTIMEKFALRCFLRSERFALPYARHFVMYHIPNGGRRNKITGARLKAEGVVAGVPDVFLASPRQGFRSMVQARFSAGLPAASITKP